MRLSKQLISAAFALAAFATTPALAGNICKPTLSFGQAQLSAREDAQNSQRRWTAILHVDASRCAATSGWFEIYFVREKENAPELEFVERLTWQTGETRAGQIEVSLDFWRDEAVLRYGLGSIAACACRQ
jgi:hypothetical protein